MTIPLYGIVVFMALVAVGLQALILNRYRRLREPTDDQKTNAIHRLSWVTLAYVVASIGSVVAYNGSLRQWLPVMIVCFVGLIAIEVSQALHRSKILNFPISPRNLLLRSLRVYFFLVVMYGAYFSLSFLPALVVPSAWKPWLSTGGFIFGLAMILMMSPVFFGLMQKTSELKDATIVGLVHNRLRQAGLPSLRVDQWPTREFKVANAAVVGYVRAPRFCRARVVISDSLLKDFSPVEIDAIVGHEIAHFSRKHVAKRMWIPLLLMLLSIAVLARLSAWHPLGDWAVFDMSPELDAVLWRFLPIVLTLRSMQLISRWLVRAQELDADWIAVNQFGIDAQLYFDTLDKLTRYSAESTRKRNPLNFLNANAAHPSSEERRRLIGEASRTGAAPFEKASYFMIGKRVALGVLTLFVLSQLYRVSDVEADEREPASQSLDSGDER